MPDSEENEVFRAAALRTRKEVIHRSVVFTQKQLCVASFFHRANARQRGKRSFFELLHCGLERRDTQKRCVYTKAAVCGFFFHRANARQRGKTKFFELPHCGLGKKRPRNFFLQPPLRGAEESPRHQQNHNPHFHDIEFTYEIILKTIQKSENLWYNR